LDAPSPSFDFLAAVVVEDVDEAEFSRDVPPPSFAGRGAEEDVVVRGEAEPDVDGLRPILGGVDTLGVPGAEFLGVAGLDHETKKSSSVSSFDAGEAEASIPSTTIPFGNLHEK
jgi:hypothetical protein